LWHTAVDGGGEKALASAEDSANEDKDDDDDDDGDQLICGVGGC